MPPRRFAVPSLLAAAIAALAASPAALAAETASTRYRMVHINDVDGSRMVWSHSGSGLVQDAMDARTQQKALLLLKTAYRHARTKAAGFDVQAFLVDAMRCLPDLAGKDDCREVVVVAGDGTRSGPPPPAGAQVDHVRIVVQNILGVMTYDFHIGDATPGADPRQDSDLSVVFHERPTAEVQAGPFPPFSGKFSEKQAAASEYWLGGANSRWESSFRRAVDDFRAIVAATYSRLQSRGAGGNAGLDLESLPLVADLQQQGRLICSKRDCKAHYLDVVEGRVWSVSDAHLVDSWALGSYADNSTAGMPYTYELASRVRVPARSTGGP